MEVRRPPVPTRARLLTALELTYPRNIKPKERKRPRLEASLHSPEVHHAEGEEEACPPPVDVVERGALYVRLHEQIGDTGLDRCDANRREQGVPLHEARCRLLRC